jgi:hypothetical protein
MDDLQLLLAHAHTARPALEHGLPGDALEHAPRPDTMPRGADALMQDAPDKDPNDLAHQRWGVIAPDGEAGDLMLEAMAPLIRHREHEQGASAHIYRVAPDMNARDAVRWRDDIYRAEHVPEAERPRYLMVLGDLHHVPFELQQVMAHSAFVGRVHVGQLNGEPDADGYAAYAAKALTHARAAAEHARTPDEHARTPEILLYTASDGTMATTLGRRQLVEPCLMTLTARARKDPAMRDVVLAIPHRARESPPGALVSAADTARPAILLSVSHGQGAPPEGWGSAARQRAEQGALVLGKNELLDADTMRSRRFMPGGMWFCLACFGAGTPRRSTFQAWLSSLVDQGRPEAVLAPLLANLPGPDDPRPFIAAMPQAALANPHGPLAMIGHVDLAWTYSFGDPRRTTRSMPSRILSVLDAWLRRARAGVALDALMRFYREVNDALMLGYQDQEDARVYNEPDPTDAMERAQLWMLRNDLRGYVLLGDPAARLSGFEPVQ